MTHEQEYSTKMHIENQQKYHSDAEIFPFEMGYLPPHFKKKAEIELHESPENIERSLRLFREMITSDIAFHGLTYEDDFLIEYLRGRKYDVTSAFAYLRSGLFLQKKNTEIFTNIKFESISVATRDNVVTFLPRRCSEGCAILRIELDNWDPEQLPLLEMKRVIMVLLMQSLHEPVTQVNGIKIIFNMKSNPVKLLRYCTPSNLHLMYHGTQECIPGRYKEIHLVNKSLVFKVGWMVGKKFFSEKFKKRLIFHPGPETLLDYFPPSVLPVEYGGELKDDLDMTEWLRKVCQPEKMKNVWLPSEPGSN